MGYVSRQITTLGIGLVVALSAYAVEGLEAWPEFRGPFGDGYATAPTDKAALGVPTTWSETENIAWKTAISHKGWSTPVAADGRVWLTTATEDGNDFFVIAVDAESGEIVVNKKLFHADHPEPLGNEVNSYASPSPAIEDGRVYVHFGSYGTASLDAKTAEVIWERTDFPCRHYRGPASSVVLFENLVYLTFDGVDLQYVVALDKATGETVWRTDRSTKWTDYDDNGVIIREGDLRKSYSTPLVVTAGGKPQLISLGSMAGFSYDPLTGEELWTVTYPGFTAATRPVYGDGLVYITNGRGGEVAYGLRLDGEGDVTDSHVVWSYEGREVPQEPSMIYLDGLLYMVSNQGAAACLEGETGEVVWTERLGGGFQASPIYADGRLYFCSVQGKTVVVKPGRTYEEVAENRLDDGMMASPIVYGRSIILRTKTHLYKISSQG